MNNVIKKMGKISSIATGIGVFLVGAIILAISLFAYFNYHDLDGKVMATISNIKKERKEEIYIDEENLNEDEQYNYTVYVDYEVDGKEYKNIELNSYNSSMKIGQTIEIQYDLNNPSKIQGQNGKTFILIFIVIGSLVIIFGIYETIKGFKLTKNNPMYDVMKS